MYGGHHMVHNQLTAESSSNRKTRRNGPARLPHPVLCDVSVAMVCRTSANRITRPYSEQRCDPHELQLERCQLRIHQDADPFRTGKVLSCSFIPGAVRGDNDN